MRLYAILIHIIITRRPLKRGAASDIDRIGAQPSTRRGRSARSSFASRRLGSRQTLRAYLLRSAVRRHQLSHRPDIRTYRSD